MIYDTKIKLLDQTIKIKWTEGGDAETADITIDLAPKGQIRGYFMPDGERVKYDHFLQAWIGFDDSHAIRFSPLES